MGPLSGIRSFLPQSNQTLHPPPSPTRAANTPGAVRAQDPLNRSLEPSQEAAALSERKKKNRAFLPFQALVSLAVFGGELLVNPRPIGAAVPSSRALARRMASFLPERPSGYVIELGAGTGAITSALLARGIPPGRLISIERSDTLVRLLRSRFPGPRIIAGDAGRLGSLLHHHLGTDHVSHIVSSLPLRSLPRKDVFQITHEVKRLLKKDGQFIQYTYHLGITPHESLASFTRAKTSLVWMNFPPARVDVFEPS